MTLEGDAARVLRGGAFYNDARRVRCASRHWYDPDVRDGTSVFGLLRLPSFMTLGADTLNSGTLENLDSGPLETFRP